MTMRYLYPCKPNTLSPTSRLFDELDRDPRWIAEVKKNGWRCLAAKEEGKLTLWTRHRTTVREPLDDLREALRGLPDGTVLDGELIHHRTRGTKGVLYLFDMLAFKGNLLVGFPLSGRRGSLEIVFKDYLAGCPGVVLAEQVRLGKKRLYLDSIEGDENEGIVLKRLDSKYPVSETRCLQNPFWLKVKKAGNHLKLKGD